MEMSNIPADKINKAKANIREALYNLSEEEDAEACYFLNKALEDLTPVD